MTSELTLSPDATIKCVAAVDQYLDGLRDLKINAHRMVRRESFGTLPSGIALGNKFAELASGTPGSFESTIEQHIVVMMSLRDTFEAAGRRYVETDSDTAAALGDSDR